MILRSPAERLQRSDFVVSPFFEQGTCMLFLPDLAVGRRWNRAVVCLVLQPRVLKWLIPFLPSPRSGDQLMRSGVSFLVSSPADMSWPCSLIGSAID